MNKITIFDAGDLLAKNRGWAPDTCAGAQDVIRYDDFLKMCVLGKLTSSERKVKELWKLFRTLGIARYVNQHEAMLFNLEAFRTIMAMEFPTWRASQ